MKGPAVKTVNDGIYNNARFIHAAASLVGCTVQVRVKNGSLFEGVFRTFSQQFDLVLEMAHMLVAEEAPPPPPTQDAAPTGNNILDSVTTPDAVKDKLIFKLQDVVMLTAANVDLDYAIKGTHINNDLARNRIRNFPFTIQEKNLLASRILINGAHNCKKVGDYKFVTGEISNSFIDSAISKFNGQVVEKELEPWDGPPADDEALNLEGKDGESANGWDANEMFKTNEEKYGVTSSYDSSLQTYTIPLEKKNTEEYKRQEAKATKIASEIESSAVYKSHIALENGDEEEKFSAVVRPENVSNARYMPPPRRRNMHNNKPTRNNSQSYNPGNRVYHSSSQTYHNTSSVTSAQGLYKVSGSVSAPNCIPTPRPVPPIAPAPRQNAAAQHSRPQIPDQSFVQTQSSQELRESKLNGGIEKPDPKPPHVNRYNSGGKDNMHQINHPPPAPNHRNTDRRNKGPGPKGRDDKEELKKFHAKFKYSEEKEFSKHKEEPQRIEMSVQKTNNTNKIEEKEKEKEIKEDQKADSHETVVLTGTITPVEPVKSNLNPDADEFVPGSSAHITSSSHATPTPPTITIPTPPVPTSVLPQHRPHTQSPVVAVPPQHQVLTGMGQPIFAPMPHPYMMPGTPISLPINPSFAHGTSMGQPPRFRKDHQMQFDMSDPKRNFLTSVIAMPLALQARHDMPPSMHVAAATGQPILAPAAMPATQLTMQYPSAPHLMSAPGQHQSFSYTPMYSLVGPRVLPPHPMSLMPTSVNCNENPHMTPVQYVSHPGMSAASHAMTVGVIPQVGAGSHSVATSTTRSQTPALHTAPSPVHQSPHSVPHGNPVQSSTPTGHPTVHTPQQVVYHNPMAAMAANPHNHSLPPSSAHPLSLPPMMMMAQQSGPGALSHMASTGHVMQGHPLHGQNPGTATAPSHLIPHPPMAVIPSSMAPTVASTHFVSHHQV